MYRICLHISEPIGTHRAQHISQTDEEDPSGSLLVTQTAMQNVRRVILYLSSAIGIWVFVSFAGAMVDSGNAAFWSSSLMWSLLSFLVVMPALALVTHASMAQQQAEQNAPAARQADEDDKMFVEEEGEAQTLWPEPNQDQDNDWPTPETRRELEQAQSSERVSAR